MLQEVYTVECVRSKSELARKPMKNEGGLDRGIRVVVGIVLLYLGLSVLKGTLGVVADILGVVMLVTAAVGYCPLYGVCKIRTNK